jgi:hypothetical protein
MLRSIVLALALTFSAGAFAQDAPAPTTPAPAAATHYPVDTVTCRDGTTGVIPRQEAMCATHGGVGPAPPAGSTALCKDNTYTSTKEHKHACSGHKGVAIWLDK